MICHLVAPHDVNQGLFHDFIHMCIISAVFVRFCTDIMLKVCRRYVTIRVMSNKLARYKDPAVLAFISKWFAEEHDNQFHRVDRFVGLADLYQTYHEYTLPIEYTNFRMDINAFAKCIVACKIMDIGGRFRHVPTYEPAPSAITRATA